MLCHALLALAAALGACGPGAARELDPAACAARFDVQRDKIIRTEESREMGARYLSELDVGARHECRRLCCETDACDVFVYEEKSPGSCYLFNCGPPEDFRCKFTAHSNFSSGVLALSRRLAELQDQERLPPPPPPPPTPRRAPHTTTTTTPPPPPPRLAASTQPPPTPAPRPTPHTTSQPPSGRCSRYQWECHSGGECIAVYNACDGVAQCADGSDEAPELGCPAAPPAPPPPPRAAPAPPARPPPPPPPPAYPPMYEQEAGASAEAGAEAVAEAGERWPHRLLQAQPRRYPEPVVEGVGVGVAPHIFSHAGGLVQEEPPAFEPPAPHQPWPRHPWPAPPRQGAESGGWAGWGRDWADDRRGWPAPAPPPKPHPPATDPEMPYLSGKTMPELPVVYGQAHSLHDAPKKGPRPAPQPQPPDLPPPPPPLDHTTQKDTEPAKSDVVVNAASAAGAAAAPAHAAGAGAAAAGAAAARRDMHDEHDGLSEHPPAAVLLLVLGVAMTGAMGVLVGCRARAARRRLRRSGKPFAHDADYLVNGMYL